MANAARRRLGEEMGVSCPLRPAGSLLYRAALDHGLTEHELTHIHVGRYAGAPQPNPEEAADWRWISLPALTDWLRAEPQAFTVWFRHMIELAGMPTVQAWSQGQVDSAVRLTAV